MSDPPWSDASAFFTGIACFQTACDTLYERYTAASPAAYEFGRLGRDAAAVDERRVCDRHRALEERLCGRRVLPDLVLRRVVVPQRAEVHQAARIAAPEVLRVRRERQHRARDLLRHAPLEHPLVRLEGPERVLLDLAPRGLARLVVDRLERVCARPCR